MNKVYLIRHAESEANAAMDLDNPTYYYDAKITEKGKEQAIKAREAKVLNHTTDKRCLVLTPNKSPAPILTLSSLKLRLL